MKFSQFELHKTVFGALRALLSQSPFSTQATISVFDRSKVSNGQNIRQAWKYFQPSHKDLILNYVLGICAGRQSGASCHGENMERSLG